MIPLKANLARSVVVLCIFLTVSHLSAQDYVTGYARSAWNLDNKEVVHVTNLNANGPGSFRDAVSRPNRIVIFDVGGIINITSALDIAVDNVVVAAFTAPGPYGVITKGRRGLKISGNNVAVVGLKVWIDSFTTNIDGIQASGNNILVAYGSTMFATDESLTTFGDASFTSIEAQDITFYKMIAVGANNGHQASGGMMNSKGVGNVDFIKCVAAFNQIRSFRFASSVQGEIQFGNQYNCVIYNWLNAATELQGPAHVNIIGNFFKRGPSNGIKQGITSENALMYIADNNSNDLSRLSNGFELFDEPFAVPFEYSFVTAEEAYDELIVQKQAGWRNSPLEDLVLEHIANGTDHSGGEDGITNIDQMGGWPVIPSATTTHEYTDLATYFASYFDGTITAPDPPVILSGIKVYPNPVSGQLTINSNGTKSSYELFDALGHAIRVNTFDRQELLDFSTLPAGMYLMRVTDEVETSQVFKIIKP